MRSTESLRSEELRTIAWGDDESCEIPLETLPREVGVFVCEGRPYCVFAQAKVRVVGEVCEIEGFEALLRDLVTGYVPLAILTEAESKRSIHQYTRQVINEAVRALEAGITVPISCNVSPTEIDCAFVAEMLALRDDISARGIDPNLLSMELLEREPLRDEQILLLRTLSDAGLRISVDDYGTGYANRSLVERLTRAGVRVSVKLDKTLADSGSVVAVAHDLQDSFGVDLIAEGVEAEDQVAALAHLSVLIQSYEVSGKPQRLADWIPEPRVS